MTGTTVRRLGDAEAFLAEAGALLSAREAEHNLMLGIASRLRGRPGAVPDAYFAVALDGGGPVAAALRTPPHQLLLSESEHLDWIAPLADDVARKYDTLPGVLGPPQAAEAFAREWSARTGQQARPGVRQRIYRAEHADLRARTPPGAMRPATVGDRALLIEWFAAFLAEALPHEAADDTAVLVDRRLADAGGGLVLWEDSGETVCLAGFGGPTPHGIRVAPVYTPPDARGRGYATALVAALTHQLLAGGRRFCFLYTDLANPTSNSIYQRIGYEPVTDATQWVFRT